jgi:hypothetical protein
MPVIRMRRVFGLTGFRGTCASATVVSEMEGSPLALAGARSPATSARESLMASDRRAACSGSASVTDTSMITVLSGVSTVTTRASAVGVVSRPRRVITGSSTAGVVASCAYDCTRFCENVEPCTSSVVVWPWVLDTNTLLVER